jgi:hypothetical protein
MATVAENREQAVMLAKSRVKRNRYTQGSLRIYVDGYPKPDEQARGFSDCSAFVRWVIQKALGLDIGYNTSAQIQNRGRGVVVEIAASGQTCPNEALLQPGDCVYFKGCAAHLWQVGHVEMYLGGGKCIGHGGGIGPTIKTLKPYSRNRGKGERKYLCAIRWIPDDPEGLLGGRLLKMGDEGADVLALQRLLKVLGYDLGLWGANKDGCDGEYGNDTKRAVRAFEEAHSLPADGIADASCIEAVLLASVQKLGKVRVTGARVNVRNGPGTSHGVIGTAVKGDILERIGSDTEAWRGVLCNGVAAYVSAKYVEAA